MRPLMAIAQLVFALSCTLQGCGKVGGPGNQDTRGPRVGQLAPEIDGKDLEGQPLKLSDFRGKVVLLSFYGEWCHYCVKQFPHERSLAERFKDRPFVLLGVNSDPSPQDARYSALRHGLSWRAFFAGGVDGEIPRRYAISGWPSLFVIDATGVIRHVAHQADRDLEIAIQVSLADAESKQ
jgi:peroxiredoxin